jgi:L-methionine (R)-S-oxide reductase
MQSLEDEEKIALYTETIERLDAIIGPELDDTGKMAIISAVLKMSMPYFFVVAFYRVRYNKSLQIGPYQGEVLVCEIISYESGVCGACATQQETIIVPDVTKYPKYIACDPLTKSEIVVPVTRHNKLIAVLDIDSTEFNSFNEIDKSYLELVVRTNFEDLRTARTR